METKEKLLTVLKIMMGTDRDNPLNATEIIRKLENEYNIPSANRKGIYADLSLIEKVGFPLRESANKSEGRYMEREFDDAEIKLMMDAIRNSKCLTLEESRIIIEKLKNLTGTYGRSRLAYLIQPKIGPKSEDAAAKDYIDLILEACYRRRQIAFQYTEFDINMNRVLRREGNIYRMSVYSLVADHDTYYMIVMDDRHRTLANYRLDRVVNLTITEEPMLDLREMLGPDAPQKIQDYIATMVDHYRGDLVHLQLECASGQRELNILYDFAGRQMYIRPEDNGRIIVTIEKQDGEALIGWLMSYAHIFRVLGPEKVRQKLQERLEAARVVNRETESGAE